MIRITLNIKNFSPFLQTASGEVLAEFVDFRELSSAAQVKTLLKCKFNYKPGQRGFHSEYGVRTDIFEALRPQIDIMISSYARGMMLAPHDYSWVDDSKDKSLNEWLDEKGVVNEITES